MSSTLLTLERPAGRRKDSELLNGHTGTNGAALKVCFITREYPPNVYGGAGGHIKNLARELAQVMDVEVRCFGDQDLSEGRLRVKSLPALNDTDRARAHHRQRHRSTSTFAKRPNQQIGPSGTSMCEPPSNNARTAALWGWQAPDRDYPMSTYGSRAIAVAAGAVFQAVGVALPPMI
jgi:hypothetical protein